MVTEPGKRGRYTVLDIESGEWISVEVKKEVVNYTCNLFSV
jgi:hypothetical protein